MRKRRIMGLVLTVGMVVGVASVTLASEDKGESLKVAAIKTTETETKTEYLSDEEAVKVANEAMKYYLNIDTNCFSGSKITRFDTRKNVEVEVEGQKYMVDSNWANKINKGLEEGDIEGAKDSVAFALIDDAPSNILVEYIDPENNDGEYRDNAVTINAETGEVIRISRHNACEEAKGKIDKNGVKEAVVNFLKKSNLEAVPETKWDEMLLSTEVGEAYLCLKVNGGMTVGVKIDLEDLSVINFYKTSIMYPHEEFKTL